VDSCPCQFVLVYWNARSRHFSAAPSVSSQYS
jgi:hypothetical protein